MEQTDVGNRADLVRYRIATAKDDIRAAELLLDAKAYKAANNRAYYAVFHAINAVHAIKGNAYKRHKDAIGFFNKEYIKEEVFPRELARKIVDIEEIRNASDYDDFYLASKEETVEQIAAAKEIVGILEEYCLNNI